MHVGMHGPLFCKLLNINILHLGHGLTSLERKVSRGQDLWKKQEPCSRKLSLPRPRHDNRSMSFSYSPESRPGNRRKVPRRVSGSVAIICSGLRVRQVYSISSRADLQREGKNPKPL